MSQRRTARQILRQRRNAAAGTPNADGSPLEGYVEHPRPGDRIRRQLEVSGWHAWHREPVAAITVEVAGRVVGRGRSAGARDDVAESRDDRRYAATGWIADVDLGAIQGEVAHLEVTIFPIPGRPGVRLDPMIVSLLGPPTVDVHGRPIPPDDEVAGNIDTPAPGAVAARGPTLVQGWARSTYAPISAVYLSVDDVELGPVRLGIPRLDVSSTDESAIAAVCGFEQLIDLSWLEADLEEVTVRAKARSLRGTLGEFSTTVRLGGLANDEAAALAALAMPPSRPEPLDLLVVTHDLGYGGAQLWLAELLRRAGAGSAFPCTVVAFGGGALAAELTSWGINVHVTSAPPVDDVDAYEGRLEELDAWLGASTHTAALVNTFRAFPGADLAARRGLAVVWAIHESWPEPLIWNFDHPGKRVDPSVRGAAARALASARAVVFESDATRLLYEARAPGRSVVIPYGVGTAVIDEFATTTSVAKARASLELDEGSRVLLVMGTVEPRKGQTLIAEAFAEVAADHPDAVVVFVGDLGTAYSAALATFVARSGLTDRCRLVPVTSDALTWYRAADALVCASDVESLPRSVLDAMCLGVPVVSSRVFGIDELLSDNETALLFEPSDLGSLVEALRRLLEFAPDRLAAIGDAGRRLVHEQLDSLGYATDVVTLLRGLAEDPAATPQALLASSPPAQRST